MDAGIECRTIFPLRFPWILSTLNYRDHCKIVVIDGKESFTGGINVGDEYLGLNPNIGFWRDTHLRIVGYLRYPLGDSFAGTDEDEGTLEQNSYGYAEAHSGTRA